MKVLLVDDEPNQLTTWSSELRHEWPTITVLDATGYDQARRLAHAERPQIAIVDMLLRDNRSGLHLIQELRAFEPLMYLHLASAYAGIESSCMAMRCGSDNVSRKPTSAVSVVKEALGMQLDPGADPVATCDEVERDHLERTLIQFNWNITQAAEALDLYPHSLRRKMARHRLHPPMPSDKGPPRRRRRKR